MPPACEDAGVSGWLEGLVDWHRATLLRKCAGLTAEQLKRRSVEPSDLSLLGLVRHMTNVERGWFWDFAGEMTLLHWSGADPSSGWTDFSGVGAADPEADLAVYHQTCQRSRDLVAGASLDDTFTEEYAGHNGHADLLRERIDGITGQ